MLLVELAAALLVGYVAGTLVTRNNMTLIGKIVTAVQSAAQAAAKKV